MEGESGKEGALTKASLELLVGQSKGLLDVGQGDVVRSGDDTLSNLARFTNIDQQHILNYHAISAANVKKMCLSMRVHFD